MRQANISSASRTPTPRLALSKDGRQGACLTQAERLFVYLRRRPYTVMEMLQLGISVAPWKRLAESTRHLRPGERLKLDWNKAGLRTYRVVRGC